MDFYTFFESLYETMRFITVIIIIFELIELLILKIKGEKINFKESIFKTLIFLLKYAIFVSIILIFGSNLLTMLTMLILYIIVICYFTVKKYKREDVKMDLLKIMKILYKDGSIVIFIAIFGFVTILFRSKVF